MTTELIIGATGFVGRHMAARLPDARLTVRPATKSPMLLGRYVAEFDLLNPTPLPEADIVYNCTGVNGNRLVSEAPPRDSYRINVEGPAWVVEHFQKSAFHVWISSMSADFGQSLDDPDQGGTYAQQKRMAEFWLRFVPNVATIRAGLIIPANIDEFCELMIGIGRARVPGLTRWNEDDTLGRWK